MDDVNRQEKKGAPKKDPKPAKAAPAGKVPAARDLRKKVVMEALEQSLGVVTTACRKAGINRDTFYQWLKNDPEFKAAYEDLANVALDFAESKLHQRIAEGSDACTIFYLKTKGKHRGYVERTEIGGGGTPLAIRVVTTDTEISGAIDEI